MSNFLGHLVQRRGYKGFLVPAGEAVPLLHRWGTVTPVYDGPQTVTTPTAREEAPAEGEGVIRAVDHLTVRMNKPGAFRIDDEPHLRTLLAALASREESPDEGVGDANLETFGPEVTDVQSRFIIVHQLRASADIQDGATKRETGWATTSDRALLMRKAADTIESLAALRNRTSEPEAVVLDRDQIAKIIDPEAFVPMEDIIGMRKAYVKADAILAGAAA